MKPGAFKSIVYLTVAISLLAGFTGCKDLFTDPTKDKDTGDKVGLLILDRNFIHTTIAIRLNNLNTGAPVDQEEVTLWFYGKDSTFFITFDGTRQSSYKTSSGYVEVGLDPNRVISRQDPLEFTILATSTNYVSAPLFVSYSTEGIKNLTIEMISLLNSPSMVKGAFDEPYDVTYGGVPNAPIMTEHCLSFRSVPTGTDWSYLNFYTFVDEDYRSKSLICSNLRDHVLYSDYGFYYFNNGVSLYPPQTPVKTLTLTGRAITLYTAILKSGLELCSQGLTIHVDKSDGGSGSGVFDYLITFSNGDTKRGTITCDFTTDNVIDQIYYPSANPAVSVTLYGDAQYSMSSAVNLSSPCGAVANFTATPLTGLKAHKLSIRYVCRDNEYFNYALSIGGEFRLTGTTGAYTPFQFVGGVATLQLKENAQYDFRINTNSEYHEFSLWTDESRILSDLNVVHPDYTIREISITHPSNTVDIMALIELSSGVCDLLN